MGRGIALLDMLNKEGISDHVKAKKRPKEIESSPCNYLREEGL